METYYNRNSIDYVARNEEYKKKFIFFEKQTGLTHEQIICSTKVIMCNKEPDSTMWAKSLQDVSIANDDIPAILFFLSFNGYTHAISVMKQILQGVNGKKSWGDFAASTLFKSPTPWYPIAKYIIDSGTVRLKNSLYAVYLPEYVYKKMKSGELKDSLTELICYGLKSEFVPSCLNYADDLLVLIEGSEYSNSIERFYYINKKYKSNEMNEYVQKRGYVKYGISKVYIPRILKKLNEVDSLRSENKFKILFNIKEDIDSIKLNWDLSY